MDITIKRAKEIILKEMQFAIGEHLAALSLAYDTLTDCEKRAEKRKENLEAHRAREKRYYEAHKAECLERSSEYRLKHKEELREKQKERRGRPEYKTLEAYNKRAAYEAERRKRIKEAKEKVAENAE